MGEQYNIDGEKLGLGQIVSRCELIASQDPTKFFVGRETIRGRLRIGVRSWNGLTSKVKNAKQRATGHCWRDPKAARRRSG